MNRVYETVCAALTSHAEPADQSHADAQQPETGEGEVCP